MEKQLVGTCGVCGGQVTAVKIWMGVGPPPPPTCESCGREAIEGKVLDMKPGPAKFFREYKPQFTIREATP